MLKEVYREELMFPFYNWNIMILDPYSDMGSHVPLE